MTPWRLNCTLCDAGCSVEFILAHCRIGPRAAVAARDLYPRFLSGGTSLDGGDLRFVGKFNPARGQQCWCFFFVLFTLLLLSAIVCLSSLSDDPGCSMASARIAI